MRPLPKNIARSKAALEKQGYVLERDYVERIVTQWNVKPSSVKRALRRGAGNRFLKHVTRFEQRGSRTHMYLFVEPVSARKWLAFALDRIVVEVQS